MSGERDDEGFTRPRKIGFYTYADDTPRALDGSPAEPQPLPDEPTWGFEPDDDPAQPERRPQGGRKLPALLVAGGALVLVAGGLAGVLLRETPDRRPAAEQPLARSTQTVPVEVVAPPPSPVPASTGLLQVLPPQGAASARLEGPQGVPAFPVARPAPARVDAAPVGDPSAAAYASAPSGPRPAPPCYGSRAERMVCADADLRRQDERMQAAYEEALEAGVPERDLRDEQADWREIREDAANDSRDAVASIYRQRIAELRRMARRERPEPDPRDYRDPDREP